ncbi:hypothetical protein GLOIN_2v1882339 [Rhizophagus irregularis DAOM 181602=DAOM 197198]|nr:hypothetical protein GLOIN_2v1882339 [Rhizophagus irregularis DAOM 181602=DAOM 197198]
MMDKAFRQSSSLNTEERILRLERGMSSIQEQMSTGAKIDEIPINYTKKFGEIAPQLEKDLIPRIQSLLEQRGIHATLSIVWDVFSDLHKNGQRKWKESQLNEAEIKQKKIMSHIINRLSEKTRTKDEGRISHEKSPRLSKIF